jgi:hypothetical protein
MRIFMTALSVILALGFSDSSAPAQATPAKWKKTLLKVCTRNLIPRKRCRIRCPKKLGAHSQCIRSKKADVAAHHRTYKFKYRQCDRDLELVLKLWKFLLKDPKTRHQYKEKKAKWKKTHKDCLKEVTRWSMKSGQQIEFWFVQCLFWCGQS